MDSVDRSQSAEFLWRRTNEHRHTLSMPTGLISARECVDCGCRIPEPRRRAVPGCTRCAGCQEAAEG